jgi:hypothetical protein
LIAVVSRRVPSLRVSRPRTEFVSPFRTASPHPGFYGTADVVRAARHLDGPVDIVWPADATCD